MTERAPQANAIVAPPSAAERVRAFVSALEKEGVPREVVTKALADELVGRYGIKPPKHRWQPPTADDPNPERTERQRIVQATWNECPKRMLNGVMAPAFRRAVESWAGDRSLILLGPTATGKTTAAVRLVYRLCCAGVNDGGKALHRAQSIAWLDADDLTRAGGSERVWANPAMVERARNAWLLVLDDVASPSKTVMAVLRYRAVKRRLPSLITSGCVSPTQVPHDRELDELKAALGGEAVLRHVLEATGVEGDYVIARKVPKAA